jgi:hypothetical protein
MRRRDAERAEDALYDAARASERECPDSAFARARADKLDVSFRRMSLCD